MSRRAAGGLLQKEERGGRLPLSARRAMGEARRQISCVVCRQKRLPLGAEVPLLVSRRFAPVLLNAGSRRSLPIGLKKL